MNSTLTAPRALTALLARRVIKLATIIACCVLLFVIVVASLLVYFFSGWWWLLVVPFFILFVIFLIVRFIAVLIVRAIHPNNLTNQQQTAMGEFIDKIQAALEARATPLPLIILICLKDILFHRDVVTVKKLIKDTAGLRKDYAEIEKLF